MGVHETKTFLSGNSVAVRLPRELGVLPGTPVSIRREGGEIVIKPKHAESKEELRARMERLIARLNAIGRTGPVEVRDPDIFPDRPGLY